MTFAHNLPQTSILLGKLTRWSLLRNKKKKWPHLQAWGDRWPGTHSISPSESGWQLTLQVCFPHWAQCNRRKEGVWCVTEEDGKTRIYMKLSCFNVHENTFLSGYLSVFVVCVRRFICHRVLFCSYIFACDIAKIWSESSEWRHPCACEECKTFTKEDDVSNDPETFSCHMFTYDLVCVDKKVCEIDDQNRLFGLVTHPVVWLQLDTHRHI